MSIPTRDSNDPNASADINDLQTQITQNVSDISNNSITAFFLDGNLVVGDGQLYIPVKAGRTLTSIRADVITAPSGAGITIDLEVVGGSSIFGTLLTIDDGETSSSTAATPAVLSTTSFTQFQQLKLNIDQVGSSTSGAYLFIYLIWS